MAEIRIKLKGIQELQKSIEKIQSTLGKSLEVPLRQAGLHLMAITGERFEQQISPGGSKWEKLKDSTIARRRSKSSAILQDRGTLKNSVSSNPRIYKLDENSLEFGTNLPYANVHQFGDGGRVKIPPRQIDGVVKLRTNRKGELLRQKKHQNLAVFAKKTHKLYTERKFSLMTKGHNITIPARPYLGINKDDMRQIEKIFSVYADEKVK